MPPSPPLIHIHSDTLSNVCTCRRTRVHLQTSASAPDSFLLLWQGEGCGNMLPFVRSRSALKTIMEVYWTNFRNELGKPSEEASFLNHQSPCPLLLDKAGPGGYFEAENYLKWCISLPGKMRNFYWRRYRKERTD